MLLRKMYCFRALVLGSTHVKGAVSLNSAKSGYCKMSVKLKETKITA